MSLLILPFLTTPSYFKDANMENFAKDEAKNTKLPQGDYFPAVPWQSRLLSFATVHVQYAICQKLFHVVIVENIEPIVAARVCCFLYTLTLLHADGYYRELKRKVLTSNCPTIFSAKVL